MAGSNALPGAVEISQAVPGIVQFHSLLKRTPLRNQAGFSRTDVGDGLQFRATRRIRLAGLHAARSADARRVLVRNCLVRIAQFCVDHRWRDRVGDVCNGCDLKTAWIFWTRLTKSSRTCRSTNMDDNDGEQIVEDLAGRTRRRCYSQWSKFAGSQRRNHCVATHRGRRRCQPVAKK
jgi:hypothetical protein